MHAQLMDGAVAESGRSFFAGSSGRWAAEQMVKALQAGNFDFGASNLRTLDVLRKDEWILYDEVLVEEALMRLTGVADLRARGLVKTIPNGLGKLMLQWEQVSDLSPAVISLDGISKGENDRPDFTLANLPLPITHKDFFIHLRTLMASRNRGEALDTTTARLSTRQVAEKLEEMLFQGGPTFAGAPIYGYTTYPYRNLKNFEATGGLWSNAAKTGDQIIADVLAGIGVLQADRMYGPYMIYISPEFTVKLEGDFKANGDRTIRDRILAIDKVMGIAVSDKMPANKVVIVQMTSDVIEWVEGEPLQTIQWDVEGGMRINMKVMTIQVPLIKSTQVNRCGICVMGLAVETDPTPTAPAHGDTA